jgi:hypothetical protein
MRKFFYLFETIKFEDEDHNLKSLLLKKQQKINYSNSYVDAHKEDG